MLNKYFLGLINTNNILWIKLKPSIEVVNKIEKITKIINQTKKDIFFFENDIKAYNNFYPRRYPHQLNNTIYAISIFNKEIIDFILIKNTELFDKVHKLYKEEFNNK